MSLVVNLVVQTDYRGKHTIEKFYIEKELPSCMLIISV